MGIARGLFVVDTHVHAQRLRPKFKERGITKPDYATLQREMRVAEAYDNSERLLYHMERYGVDMCVIQPAFGMSNEINARLVEKYPDKFIAFCNDTETTRKAWMQQEKWTIEAACKEIDEALSTGLFKGIGEGLTRDRQRREPISWEERFDQIYQIMEVAKKHKVPVSYHTGTVTGYTGGRSFSPVTAPDQSDPMLAHEVAEKYPEVPIILAHGGMQGWWSEMFYERALHVAATQKNVYLETGLYWAELYEKPLLDPDIGPEKLLWDTDWGASIPIIYQPGHYPPTYANQFRAWGLPAHQTGPIALPPSQNQFQDSKFPKTCPGSLTFCLDPLGTDPEPAGQSRASDSEGESSTLDGPRAKGTLSPRSTQPSTPPLPTTNSE